LILDIIDQLTFRFTSFRPVTFKMSTAHISGMSSNEDGVSQIQSIIEKLDKLPDSHPKFPTVYHASNATKIDSIKTSLTIIIEREYAKSSMKEQLLNQLNGIKVRAVNLTDDNGKAVVPDDFDKAKILLVDLMHDIQSDLSRGLPPKKESNKPFISNFIINQQTTTIDIIGLLEKAVESESLPEDKKKNALQLLKNLKNDPVLSQLIACGITQLAAKALG
jgi:hypothetical protein